MSLKCGIVGLPNVGKSTLFNCVSSGKAQSANFPFCTIEPNLGSTNVPDKRKGIDYLVSACKQIASSYPDFSKELGVVVFGNQAEQYASLFPFPIYPILLPTTSVSPLIFKKKAFHSSF